MSGSGQVKRRLLLTLFSRSKSPHPTPCYIQCIPRSHAAAIWKTSHWTALPNGNMYKSLFDISYETPQCLGPVHRWLTLSYCSMLVSTNASRSTNESTENLWSPFNDNLVIEPWSVAEANCTTEWWWTCPTLLCDPGPYGDKDDQQLFIQKVIPETDQLFVRLCATGKRYLVCEML